MRRIHYYLWPLLILLAGFGWTRLRLDTQLENMLGPGVPAVDAYLAIKDHYAISDQVRVMVCAELPGSALSGEAVDALRDTLRQSPELEAMGVRIEQSPESLARHWVVEHFKHGRAYLDEAGIAALRARLDPEAMEDRLTRHRLRLATPQPAEVTRLMLRDPLDLRELIPEGLFSGAGDGVGAAAFGDEAGHTPDPFAGQRNAAGDARLFRLAVPFPASDVGQSSHLHAVLTEIATGLEADYPGMRVYLAGPHLLAAESASRVKADMQGTMVLASIGLIAAFLLVWRRVMPVLALLIATGVSLFTAFGVYGLSGWPLSPLAALSGGMLAGLGVDYGIHLLNEVRDDRSDTPPNGQAHRAARQVARPLIIACATTTCGFLALAATEPYALVQLALLGSLGLVIAAYSALTLLPALADRLHARTPDLQGDAPRLLVAISGRPALLRTAGLAAVLVLVLFVWLTHGGQQRDGLHDLHPTHNPALQAQQQIADRFGERPGSVLLLMRADSTEQLHADLDALRDLPIDFDVTSAASLLPRPGRDARNAELLAGLDPAATKQALLQTAERVGFRPEAFEPAGDFIESFLRSPSPGLLELAASPDGRLFFPKHFDRASPQTIAVLTPRRTWDTHDKRREDLAALGDAIKAIPGARATGLDLIGEALRQQVRGDLLRAFTWSVVPIFLILLIGLRSLKRVLMTAMPPAMGLLAAAVVQQLGSGQWNAINLASVPLILGVGVDASLMLGDAASGGSLLPVRRRLRAIHLTFLTTFVGFGTLSWTSIPAVRELGWMVLAGLAAVLLGTWLFGLSSARTGSASRG